MLTPTRAQTRKLRKGQIQKKELMPKKELMQKGKRAPRREKIVRRKVLINMTGEIGLPKRQRTQLVSRLSKMLMIIPSIIKWLRDSLVTVKKTRGNITRCGMITKETPSMVVATKSLSMIIWLMQAMKVWMVIEHMIGKMVITIMLIGPIIMDITVVITAMADMAMVDMDQVIGKMKKKTIGTILVMIKRKRAIIQPEMKSKKILKCYKSSNQTG
jgi:hypothetical protein